MTESVLNLVVRKLNNLITQEANLLIEVDAQVRLLRYELEWMLMFIQHADIKRRSDPRVRLWVRQLREIAFRAEDVIDEFMVKIDHYHQRRSVRNSIWFIRCLKRCVHRTYHLPFLHELGSQIQGINTMTKEISANKSKYCIESIGESSFTSSCNYEFKSTRNTRRASYVDEESDAMALKNDIEKVKSLLVGEEQRRAIVSIVGMGGLGKTTLANKVYNNGYIKRHFDCCAWVSVSQDYGTKELLQSIIKCFLASPPQDNETEDDLRKKLREYLQGNKKYLIVLDDVWDIEAWDVLSSAFPDQDNGSRVLITTRNKEIALRADEPGNIHELRFLDDEESWQLFLKKIFRPGKGTATCPKELELLGKKMVGRCGGLPLAIVVLGGILSAKDKTTVAWTKVRDNLNWYLNETGGGSNSCMGILALSYYDLPHYLKPMFLYLGIFPEDHEISATKLIHYWVAEGFIKRRGKQSLEDIAEDYLEVLIDKSMIQVTKWRADGRAKYFRIHDLIRDLSIREAEDDKFFYQYGNIDFSCSNDVRRVSIHDTDHIQKEKFISQYPSIQHLRSLLCFTDIFGNHPLRCFTNGVKLLRVLELENVRSFDKLPKEIGQLVHLNYLGLCHTRIRTLPRSIGRLVNLQTLDVRHTLLRYIHNVFWNLHQLRHLYLNDKFCFSMSSFISNRYFRRKCSSGLDHLPNLQTLVISVGDWINIGRGLSQPRMLRKLALYGSLVLYKNVVSDFIIKLDGLRSLVLQESDEIPSLKSFSSFNYLYKMMLDGYLEKLPDLEFFPPNLNKLTLWRSELKSDPMVILQQLPNLKVLELSRRAFIGKKMICSEGGFLRLQELILRGLKLQEWIVEKGALISLKHLTLEHCEKLKMIPDGLQEVTTLITFTYTMDDDNEILKSRLRQDEGEDWYKIQHIPSVQINWV